MMHQDKSNPRPRRVVQSVQKRQPPPSQPRRNNNRNAAAEPAIAAQRSVLHAERLGISSLDGLPVSLSHIEVLCLQENNLLHFYGMPTLPHLKFLHVDSNRISSFLGMSHQPKLEILTIENNPICSHEDFRLLACLACGENLHIVNYRVVSGAEKKEIEGFGGSGGWPARCIAFGYTGPLQQRPDEDDLHREMFYLQLFDKLRAEYASRSWEGVDAERTLGKVCFEMFGGGCDEEGSGSGAVVRSAPPQLVQQKQQQQQQPTQKRLVPAAVQLLNAQTPTPRAHGAHPAPVSAMQSVWSRSATAPSPISPAIGQHRRQQPYSGGAMMMTVAEGPNEVVQLPERLCAQSGSSERQRRSSPHALFQPTSRPQQEEDAEVATESQATSDACTAALAHARSYARRMARHGAMFGGVGSAHREGGETQDVGPEPPLPQGEADASAPQRPIAAASLPRAPPHSDTIVSSPQRGGSSTALHLQQDEIGALSSVDLESVDCRVVDEDGQQAAAVSFSSCGVQLHALTGLLSVTTRPEGAYVVKVNLQEARQLALDAECGCITFCATNRATNPSPVGESQITLSTSADVPGETAAQRTAVARGLFKLILLFKCTPSELERFYR